MQNAEAYSLGVFFEPKYGVPFLHGLPQRNIKRQHHGKAGGKAQRAQI